MHLIFLATTLVLTTPAMRAAEQDEVNQATTVIERFKTLPEKQISRHVLRDAKGVAILTILKGAFIWSGKIGDGVVVARTAHGWTGPSFIRTAGAGFGAQIGGETTELVLVLNTPAAVRAFEGGGTVQLGGELSVAAGPVGRDAEAGVTPKAAVYAYSRSQGLFAGASIEGMVIATHDAANERYYHHPVSARAILVGDVTRPRGAAELSHAL
jgi:lipid-binding SYLF domain-containing protein